MCRQLGIEQEVVPGIATAFGGGIGGTGSVCGGLAGAVMAIGLRHGRREPAERDAKAYALTQELRRRFEAAMGHVDCRDLTGMDLGTREGVKRFYASDVPRTVCMPAVGGRLRDRGGAAASAVRQTMRAAVAQMRARGRKGA